jgi:hypothetical protein
MESVSILPNIQSPSETSDLNVPLGGQTKLQARAEGICVCGAPGKPMITLDGRRGYICGACFTNEIRAYLGEAEVSH